MMNLSFITRSFLAAIFMLSLHPGVFAQPVFPVPAFEDNEGFEKIFNGQSLDGWDGDPVYWSVKDGTIIGVVTPETILERNTFLIWREGFTEDFELKLEYRISAEGNSGINYRSEEVDEVPWALKGYQADIDGKGQWTGQNYEERGRTFLALRGQVCRIESGKKPMVIGSPGEKEALQEFIKADWNEVHLIVRGNVLVHIFNGQVMSIVIDDDLDNRKMKGLLGVQVHVGPPMQVEYRNIRYKKL
jgi:hypothetical protein